WLPILFRPPPWMTLTHTETLVATYVYGIANDTKTHRDEILAKSSQFSAKISSFKTLCSGNRIDENVLNVLASMLTYDERSVSELHMNWYMPSTFA
ncbi:hypothetical protein S245_006424, partial [Arachis hypogaea]